MQPKTLISIAIVFLLLPLTGCKDEETESGEDPAAAEARRAVLAHLGENVILASYQDFLVAAEALDRAVADWQTSGSEEDRVAAQTAWQTAMALWQEAEVYQVGPAGRMDSVVGGEDIRDEIYSWPLVNPCRVDQELVEQAYTDADAFSAEAPNVKGLDALEYLLFSEGTDNACAPNSTINTDGSWAGLTEMELAERRAAYAGTLTALLQLQAQELVAMWEGEGGFLTALQQAGMESEHFDTTQGALNSLSDAMFYLEKEAKDMKLAVPLGLTDCDTDICLEELESRYAFRSKEHLLANMRAFRKLLVGGENAQDPGLDDLLARVDAQAVSDDLVNQLDTAIAAMEAVDGTLAEALQTDKESVMEAYNALQGAMMLFKTQYITVLDLNPPQRAESDND